MITSNDKFSICQAEQNDIARWDAYVLNHSDSSPYHLFAWRRAVEAAYGHRCHYLYAEVNGQVVGLLPLVNIKLPFFRNELVALPYCDVGNCLTDSDRVQDALLKEMIQFSRKIGATKVSLRGRLQATSFLEKHFVVDRSNKVRMLLSLPADSEQLFASFKTKLRTKIRKAERNGISFRWGKTADLEEAYSVFARNMHRLGSPVHSLDWLRKVLAFYQERAKVGLVELEGKVVGMGVVLTCGNVVANPWASILFEYGRLRPNKILYWNFLKFSIDNGFGQFDFGRSTEGEGTYNFKKQWGAQAEQLDWYSFTNDSKKDDEEKNEVSCGRDKMIKVWQKLPLAVANTLGPKIRKYISL